MAERIEDYAIIGDGETVALVSRSGSIDWLCWPRFDSPACFAALLGSADHGRWRIAPTAQFTCRRRYRAETLILETTFETPEGVATVVDFMPQRGSASDIVRVIRGIHGRVSFRSELRVRFGYGHIVPWITTSADTVSELNAVAGPDRLTLRAPLRFGADQDGTATEFDVAAGEEIAFTLTYSRSHLPVPAPIEVAPALAEAERFWMEWSARCEYQGPWREAVQRSLVTLKALIYQPTGGIVAAATTSLPEYIGSERNWDYRYCWLRDATFTLSALLDAGYLDEARRWRDWLVRALAGSPAQAQIMYGLAGERRLTEWEVDWLPGYENSRPVRIGNAAADQHQLDVYGEVANTLHHARNAGLAPAAAAWSVQCALTNHVSSIWERPDEGIWETRGPRQQFVHSKIMAWVAIDRAIRAAEQYGLSAPLDQWRRVRRRIHADVCARGFDSRKRSFVQAYDSEHLDASLLMIPLVGFLPPEDPRVRGTVDAIGRELMVDGLVRRYHTTETDDGLPPGEGAFLACSFWYVDNLVMLDRHDEARELFEHLLTLRNDVGLLAEEYDTRARRQLGNFPQAFSHVALSFSAYRLSEACGAANHRSHAGSQDLGARNRRQWASPRRST
jgi:GH15 family glucan-1,4-alpha-glucosidase